MLPRSISSKSTGEEEDNDDIGNLESQNAELERSENVMERSEGEGQADSQGDSSADNPPSPTTKADNQTILHFIGEKERVRHILNCI